MLLQKLSGLLFGPPCILHVLNSRIKQYH